MGEWIEHDGSLTRPVNGDARIDVRWITDVDGKSYCERTGCPPTPARQVYDWTRVSHYRLVEPEQPSEQAHMTILASGTKFCAHHGQSPRADCDVCEAALQATIANDLRQAHMMSVPTTERRHVSDLAWQAFTRANGNGLYREEVEQFRRNEGTVLLTVAEHDELLATERAYMACAAKASTAESERDSLRAEVERLRTYLDDIGPRIDRAQKVLSDSGRHLGKHVIDGLCDEIERLRKGREDERDGEIYSGVHVRMGSDIPSSKINLSMADTLDHRLGTPQPDGEPVAPMSARKPYRWGMV